MIEKMKYWFFELLVFPRLRAEFWDKDPEFLKNLEEMTRPSTK